MCVIQIQMEITTFLFPISGVVFLPPFSGGQFLVLLLFRSSNPSESLLSIDLIDFSAFRFRAAPTRAPREPNAHLGCYLSASQRPEVVDTLIGRDPVVVLSVVVLSASS